MATISLPYSSMKMFNKSSILTVLGASLVLCLTGSFTAFAATDPGLGAAASFSVLGQTAITDAGAASAITGNVGMNASGASITGLTTANVIPGTIYATNLAAPSEGIIDPSVQFDAAAAYGVPLTGQGIEGTPIVGALDGQTRTSGVYDMGAILLGGGTFTLDGPGVYIFRSASSLTVAGNINLINGARACDVYWRIADDATINAGGPGSSFAGTILANTGVLLVQAQY